MMVSRFFALILAGLALLTTTGLHAQEVDRIAVVVNDEIISLRDLEARIKLALVISNLPDSIENRRRLLPQVMHKMIHERLQLQEAARVKVQVGPEDLARGIASIERQNRMPAGALLGSLVRAGVDPNAVKEQIRADLAWLKVVSRLLQPTVRVGEEEITERLDMMAQMRGQPEYLLGEIVLPVDSPTRDEEVRRLGERLIDQIRTGAPFQALARQFSQSGSAGNGGMIGWVNDLTIDDDLREPVSKMEKGQISSLIRTSSGYSILLLADRRIAGGVSEPDRISLFRLVFPTPTVNTPPIEQLKAKAAEMTAGAKDCDTLEELAGEINSPKSGRVDNLVASALPPEVARAIAGLPVGKASEPREGPDGLTVLMVCSGGGDAGLPSRAQIRRRIEDERVDMLSRRHIRDLRRAAFVDYRL